MREHNRGYSCCTSLLSGYPLLLGALKPHVGLQVPLNEFARAFHALDQRSIVGKAVILPQQLITNSKL